MADIVRSIHSNGVKLFKDGIKQGVNVKIKVLIAPYLRGRKCSGAIRITSPILRGITTHYDKDQKSFYVSNYGPTTQPSSRVMKSYSSLTRRYASFIQRINGSFCVRQHPDSLEALLMYQQWTSIASWLIMSMILLVELRPTSLSM